MVSQSKHRYKHRYVIYRFFLTVVLGLILLAAIFDYFFAQQQEQFDTSPWLLTSIQLLEKQLLKAPSSQWTEQTQGLAKELGLEINLLPLNDVVVEANDRHNELLLKSDDQHITYFYSSKSLDKLIQITKPLEPTKTNWLNRLLPLLFYISIIILASIWFRPLLRDLDELTETSQAFAQNYQHDLTGLTKANTLKDLSHSFASMGNQIREMIEQQKNLTHALSHELRTPLSRIKFGLAVIDPNSPESVQTETHSIKNDIDELDSIIAHMLNYAKIEHTNSRLELQDIETKTWIESLCSFKPKRDLVFKSEVMNDSLNSMLDPYLMELAISNLLANAEKYASTTIKLSFRQETDNNILIIEDDGPGIPEDERQSVFNAFQQLPNERSEHGGFGLGLAIVARILNLHQGAATATTSNLGGAKFLLTWPIKPTI